MHKIGVLVSGRGSNLQAIMDRIADGYLPLEIAVVISDKPDAFALERAQKADIKTVAVERKACASKEEFEAKINATLEAEGCELVVLAGFMRILSADFVNKWQHKIINIHPALAPELPRSARPEAGCGLRCKIQRLHRSFCRCRH